MTAGHYRSNPSGSLLKESLWVACGRHFRDERSAHGNNFSWQQPRGVRVYIISARLFAGLPAAEKVLWHSHVFKVKCGQRVAPSLHGRVFQLPLLQDLQMKDEPAR